MKISEAQKEVRTVYMGAFAGFLVTGFIWAISAAHGTGIGYYFPDSFTLGGWIGSAVYLLAAFPFRAFSQKQ